MSSLHDEWLEAALRMAEESVRSGGGPFGAVIIKEGEIVGKGMNRVVPYNDPTAHAEVVSIREACQKLGTFCLDGCILYSSCQPCPMCFAAIYWARVSKVYFANSTKMAAEHGFDDSLIEKELALDSQNRSVSMQQIEIDGADKAFIIWKEKEDRVSY